MPKYYTKIVGKSELSTKSGSAAIVPLEFRLLSSEILAGCSFLQNLVQQIIYATHGPELAAAKKALNDFPNPKARIDFISSYPYNNENQSINTVFNYSRDLFKEIYDLRNILAHEKWMSSNEFKSVVLFSELNENARLMMASERVVHEDKMSAEEAYEATIRYIQSIKIISVEGLNKAKRDYDICSWMLMTISQYMGETSPEKRRELIDTFHVFKGTSHLFDTSMPPSKVISVQNRKTKTIRR